MFYLAGFDDKKNSLSVLATRDFTVYFWTNETPKTFGPVMMFKELRTGKKD